MFANPPTRTACTPTVLAKRTRKGAAMFPKLLIASVIPIPVDFMAVGKLYEQIRLNKANPTVLSNRLSPINTNSSASVAPVSCTSTPKAPDTHITRMIHSFLGMRLQ